MLAGALVLLVLLLIFGSIAYALSRGHSVLLACRLVEAMARLMLVQRLMGLAPWYMRPQLL